MDSNHDIASLPPLRAELAGGTFRGITTRKDGTHCAVILLPNKATEQRNWQACVDWGREAGGELPTRTVFHLLRLSATKEELAEGGWYYTADLLSDDTGNADDAAYAWFCHLGYGTHGLLRKSFEGLAVAVRLIPLTSPAKVTVDNPDELTPPEFLASHLIDAWVAAHGKKIPWDKAIKISAIVTKMPDEERDRLLALGAE